jgi:hypothetical protein
MCDSELLFDFYIILINDEYAIGKIFLIVILARNAYIHIACERLIWGRNTGSQIGIISIIIAPWGDRDAAEINNNSG